MNTPLTHESTCDAESNFKRLLSTTKPPFSIAPRTNNTRQQCLASRLDLRRARRRQASAGYPAQRKGVRVALFSGILREGFFAG